MEIIETTASRFVQSNKNPNNCVVKGHGKIIIVPNSIHLLSEEPHTKVLLEISHHNNKTRIARVKNILRKNVKK